MGKVAQRSRTTVRRSGDKKILRVRGGNLTAEQRRKYALLRAWLKDQAELTQAMTPTERADERRAWQRFKHSINSARAGYREVIVD